MVRVPAAGDAFEMVTLPTSTPVRMLIALLLFALGALAFIRLAGGPDPLGDAYTPIFAALLLAWFVPELREEQTPWIRRMLWIGVGGAVLVLLAVAGELLF